jgi:hypothetical protein
MVAVANTYIDEDLAERSRKPVSMGEASARR